MCRLCGRKTSIIDIDPLWEVRRGRDQRDHAPLPMPTLHQVPPRHAAWTPNMQGSLRLLIKAATCSRREQAEATSAATSCMCALAQLGQHSHHFEPGVVPYLPLTAGVVLVHLGFEHCRIQSHPFARSALRSDLRSCLADHRRHLRSESTMPVVCLCMRPARWPFSATYLGLTPPCTRGQASLRASSDA